MNVAIELNNNGGNMKATVVKFINDKQAAKATVVCKSPEELKSFLTKMDVQRSMADVRMDFEIYFERTYQIHQEVPDESESLH
jgi:hypothetical protein